MKTKKKSMRARRERSGREERTEEA